MDISGWTLLWTALCVGALLLGLGLRLWLAQRQWRCVAQHRAAVPAAFAHTLGLDAHQKAADYTAARLRFSLLESALDAVLFVAWTLLGGLGALNALVLRLCSGPMVQQLVLLAAFALIGNTAALPLAWHQSFRLEARFGFNTTTPALWWADVGKSALLGLALGLPLAALILWLMGQAGAWWWLWAWGAWVAFALCIMVAFPLWIAPLFNRFTPLHDEALAQRVAALMQRCGFQSKGIFVMDASRRSAHANAYFTGLGRAKRVVFFDTLLQKLSPDEVLAVLAHELGHFHHRHVLKRMALIFSLSLAGFALLGWCYGQVWFYAGLGVMPNLFAPNAALALILFMLVVPLWGYFAAPLMAALSRKHEFEADAFAAQHASAEHLQQALLKLYEDNASTLTPDAWYVRWYHSHPPAAQRMAHLQALRA